MDVKVIKNSVREKKPDSEINAEEAIIEVFDTAHAGKMMKTFNELRKQNLFTDVILSVTGKEFSCHRAVLVAGSNYFRFGSILLSKKTNAQNFCHKYSNLIVLLPAAKNCDS